MLACTQPARQLWTTVRTRGGPGAGLSEAVKNQWLCCRFGRLEEAWLVNLSVSCTSCCQHSSSKHKFSNETTQTRHSSSKKGRAQKHADSDQALTLLGLAAPVCFDIDGTLNDKAVTIHDGKQGCWAETSDQPVGDDKMPGVRGLVLILPCKKLLEVVLAEHLWLLQP